jgi:hypothetical protein
MATYHHNASIHSETVYFRIRFKKEQQNTSIPPLQLTLVISITIFCQFDYLNIQLLYRWNIFSFYYHYIRCLKIYSFSSASFARPAATESSLQDCISWQSIVIFLWLPHIFLPNTLINRLLSPICTKYI